MWRFGSGDWLEVFRVYNLLGPDFRPVGRPGEAPMRPRSAIRYKHFILACGKYAAKVEEGLDDAAPQSIAAMPRRDEKR